MASGQAVARGRALTWGIPLLLAGCAVGPNFRTPPPPQVDAYGKDGLPPATTAANAPTGDAQHFLEGADVPERWWTTFASDEIDRRVEQALTHSPSLSSAQAALRQAQENANAARGALFPSIDAKAGATRGNANGFGFTEPSLGGGPSTFTLYNAGVSVGYTLDLFGGIRRQVEAETAIAESQRFVLEGTYQALAANVVTASFREAALREEIRATQEIITAYRTALDLIEKQNEIGAKSLADVLVVRAQVATTET